jgi:hypothetical protein
MPSLLQQETSRANGAKSRGPVTPAGKDVSRWNALQHGLRAATLVLQTENHQAYDLLCRELRLDWQPKTATEELHVDNMAAAYRKLLRAERWEAGLHDLRPDAPNKSRDLERAWQAQVRFQRAFERAQRELERLQKARRQPQPSSKKANAPKPEPFRQGVYWEMHSEDGSSRIDCILPDRGYNEETGEYEDIIDPDVNYPDYIKKRNPDFFPPDPEPEPVPEK